MTTTTMMMMMMERIWGEAQSAGQGRAGDGGSALGAVVTPKTKGLLWSPRISSSESSRYEVRTAVLIFSAVFTEPAHPWGGWKAASSPENALY